MFSVFKRVGLLFAETFVAISGRIPWVALSERWVSRTVLAGLRWLAEKNTNDLVQGEIDFIVQVLEGNRLPVLDDEYDALVISGLLDDVDDADPLWLDEEVAALLREASTAIERAVLRKKAAQEAAGGDEAAATESTDAATET